MILKELQQVIMLLWKKWIEILNSLIAETTSKASPGEGVSKLAAWTTANKCRIGIKQSGSSPLAAIPLI